MYSINILYSYYIMDSVQLTQYQLSIFNKTRETQIKSGENNRTWFLFYVEKDEKQYYVLHFGPGNICLKEKCIGKRTLGNNTSIIIENEDDTIFGLRHMKYKLHKVTEPKITNDYKIISFLIGIENISNFWQKDKLIFSRHEDSDPNADANCMALIKRMESFQNIIFLMMNTLTTPMVFPDSGTCLLYSRTNIGGIIQEKFRIVFGRKIESDVVNCQSLSLTWSNGVICKYYNEINIPLEEIIYYQNEKVDELTINLFEGNQRVSVFDKNIEEEIRQSPLQPYYTILFLSSEDNKVSEQIQANGIPSNLLPHRHRYRNLYLFQVNKR